MSSPDRPNLSATSEALLIRIVEAAKRFHPDPTRVQFSVDKATGSLYVTGVKDDTGTLIKFSEPVSV